MPPTTPHTAPPTLVLACLCAGWCTTCSAYRPVMAQALAEHPQVQGAWIDIEDDADALGDAALDIETFPTLMLLDAADGRVLFHGAVLPHAHTLHRLLQSQADGALAPGDAAQVPPAMAQAVWRLAGLRPV